MFENKTPEALKAQMLGEIDQSQGISSMAGSFADGVIGPVAEVMSDVYISLDAVPDMLFVTETSGQYIDRVGQQYYAITRRPGTRAYCDISFTGEPGLTVEAGTLFLTAGGLQFSLLSAVTLSGAGTGTGRLQSADAGAVYNVGEGSIDRMYVNLAGLETFHNAQAEGGTDPESDSALLMRIRERVQRPVTSGNGYQYRQWALGVPGVGSAKVVELQNGPGSVGIMLVDSNFLPAAEEIVADVSAAIEAQRPIGAQVTVTAPAGVEIDVAASVTLVPGADAATVQQALAQGVSQYIRDLIDDHYTPVYYDPQDDAGFTLVYNRVLAVLLGIREVENFSSLTVNGAAADIPLTAGQVPVPGEVVVT